MLSSGRVPQGARWGQLQPVVPVSRRTLASSSTARKPSLQPATAAVSSSQNVVYPANIRDQARRRIQQHDAVSPAPPSAFLRDRHQRQHTYLRISLTEKCNLRCLYCMPEDGVPLTPAERLLTFSEVERLARLFVNQGVNKIRLTGGEPTIRSDLPEIISSLNNLRPQGLQQIGITTNGIALSRKLDRLVASGLTHLNISLDTLDPFKFEFMTRRRGLQAVVKSIDRALELGIQSLKINVVVIKGLNDRQDVLDFIEFTKDRPVTVRFIEVRPPSLPTGCSLSSKHSFLYSTCLSTATSGRPANSFLIATLSTPFAHLTLTLSASPTAMILTTLASTGR